MLWGTIIKILLHSSHRFLPPFQPRGAISRPELRDIGRWKVQSNRNDRWLKSNSQQDVQTRSAAAFDVSDDQTVVSELTELKGVKVPVASSILTMFDPTQYAVSDFRVLRALGHARPRIVNPQNYTKYAEFIDHFQSYNTQSETYGFYLDDVRQIASDENLTPREVNMALWKFDQAN